MGGRKNWISGGRAGGDPFGRWVGARRTHYEWSLLSDGVWEIREDSRRTLWFL